MARRLVGVIGSANGVGAAKVYRDAKWEEWCVRFYRAGELLTDADYHTDDRADAFRTACIVMGAGWRLLKGVDH